MRYLHLGSFLRNDHHYEINKITNKKFLMRNHKMFSGEGGYPDLTEYPPNSHPPPYPGPSPPWGGNTLT